ncbi:VPS10 domain-containing receptor SorCS3-like [Salvelinus alpinus]|uniref:VPS10 domain-containing receptor SorCS3-like isoform X1 n=1 Tax=Salvelinus alpinus TaxID=8036 RepID=UPI0039FBF947
MTHTTCTSPTPWPWRTSRPPRCWTCMRYQVKTYITYNKGRDWRLLHVPATDLAGNDTHCILPFCSLHLQLQTSENPYLSGSISTKASAPGIIVATGNIESELSNDNVGMFISSDAGNNWRQDNF